MNTLAAAWWEPRSPGLKKTSPSAFVPLKVFTGGAYQTYVYCGLRLSYGRRTSAAQIARKWRLDERETRRAVNRLIAHGWLTRDGEATHSHAR